MNFSIKTIIRCLQRFSVLFLIILVQYMPVNADAPIKAQVYYDIKNGKITVEGNYENGVGEAITFAVLREDQKISWNNFEDLMANKIAAWRQAVVDNNGNFKITFAINDQNQYMLSGNYIIYISTSDPQIYTQCKFVYMNSLQATQKLAEINSISASNSSELITKLIEEPSSVAMAFALDNIEFRSMDTKKQAVLADMIVKMRGQSFTKPADFNIAFHQSVATVLIDSETDLLKMDFLIKKYSDIFGYDVTKYKALTNDALEYACKLMVENSFSQPLIVSEIFREIVIISEISKAERWSDIKATITRELPYLLQDSNYKGQATTLQENVFKDMLSISFHSIYEIENKFKEIAEKNSKKEISPNAGNNNVGKPSIIISSSAPLQDNVNDTIFKDIYNISWAEESILALAKKGIVNGYSNGEFKPYNTITREQFVKMIVSAFGIIDDTAVSDFPDVKKDDWFYRYISSASSNGVINGLGNGNFGVGKEITREDIAVIIYRILNKKNITIPISNEEFVFTDSSEISPYAYIAVNYMKKAGIMNGTGNGKFEPKRACNRAEVAKVIFELLKFIV